MKRLISFLLMVGVAMSTWNVAQAQLAVETVSPELERSYLVQLVNQLQAMIPLVIAANKAQPQNQRVSFHYTAWRDLKNQSHHGLLEDIQAVKTGIEEKLNTVTIEPRTVQPIQGDYLDQVGKNRSQK